MAKLEIDRMGRLLAYMRKHQQIAGSHPTSKRAIGRAIGVSHTQVGRLLRRAIAHDLLRPAGKGYVFDQIAPEESVPGTRWLPITHCEWNRPLRFVEEEGIGEWMSVRVFMLAPRVETWIVRFFQNEPDGGYPPRLGPRCQALVRPLKSPSDAKVDQWCLVGWRRRVRAMYRVAGGKFVLNRGIVEGEIEIPVAEVDQAAVIDTLIQYRTPTQNRRHRRISEFCSMVVASDEFKDPRCEASVISVSLETLREERRVPRQLKLPEIGERELRSATIREIAKPSNLEAWGVRKEAEAPGQIRKRGSKAADRGQMKLKPPLRTDGAPQSTDRPE